MLEAVKGYRYPPGTYFSGEISLGGECHTMAGGLSPKLQAMAKHFKQEVKRGTGYAGRAKALLVVPGMNVENGLLVESSNGMLKNADKVPAVRVLCLYCCCTLTNGWLTVGLAGLHLRRLRQRRRGRAGHPQREGHAEPRPPAAARPQ